MANEDAISSSSAGPSISFPLGFALLLVLLICMTSFLTCCFHWEKIRSFILPRAQDDDGVQDNVQRNIDDNLTQKSSPIHTISKQIQGSSLLVSMPGDEVPKFVAMECPCKPSTDETLTVTVHEIPT